MVIQDVNQIKAFIQNNIELCRLHDFLRAHRNDREVVAVANRASFNLYRASWYTVVNSAYSSVVLVREYCGSVGFDLNQLDANFTLANWHIHSCYQHDGSGNRDAHPIALGIVIRRLRNSIGHGMFAVNVENMTFVFDDEDARRRDTARCFHLEFRGLGIIQFLTALDRSFRAAFP